MLPGAKLEDPRAHRAAHSAMRCRRASQRPSWPLPSGRPSCSYMSGRSHSEEAIFSCVVKCGSLQQCGIIKKTAMRTKSITVVAESASHAHAHRRGIMCVCCAAPGAVAAQHLMLLSRDDSCSCRETPSAALFRGCCSAARAQLDPPRTPTTLGHHRQRVARLLRWHSTRTACAASGSSLRRKLGLLSRWPNASLPGFRSAGRSRVGRIRSKRRWDRTILAI